MQTYLETCKSLTSIFVLSLIAASTCQAQDESDDGTVARNSLFVEVMGTGTLVSLNYDRILLKKGPWGLAGRIGFTYTPIMEDFSDVGGPGIPVEISGLYGKRNNFFELGFGAAYHYVFDDSDDNHLLFLVPRIGYRYQKPAGGFFFRAAFTPWIPVVVDPEIDRFDPAWLPMLGVSIGHTLRVR
ncbi:MAG: hypothetical protein AAGA85_01515 [Bacteroidota bacterium]